MSAFKQSFVTFVAFIVLVSMAGPTLAVPAGQHQSPSRVAHVNRRNLCRPRPSSASQKPTPSGAPYPANATTHIPQAQSTSIPYAGAPSSSLEIPTTTETTPQPSTSLTSSAFSSFNTLTTSSSSAFIPNGMKAGVAGGDAYNILQSHIGWWYDWSANPSKPGKPIAVPMLWGSGGVDSIDAKRLAQFKQLSSSSSHPQFALGYEEPDCASGGGSSSVSVDQGVREWEGLMAPLKKRGTKIGSPSMCKQADETWLEAFSKKINTPWDFTAIHVNKDNLDGVKEDIVRRPIQDKPTTTNRIEQDHYWSTYGKPIWVTEFACVNDRNTFQPCTNQQEIDAFIQQVVDYFEHDSRVYAYAFSNGEGLGNVWPMMQNGVFSESGKAYLAAISKYH
ncbi:glycoside hydrolase family 128 protein [Macrolepiota fuliginosa MF-IS2]|uniref:Glycoside hydrolase family 128 protein n=1 Tax=Macrolepiota fuliginosa MF-IS2 TaxID=1400762 RepID=A0A9P6C4K0_9AGAR|nr:glycoside hydrolase family 128 protein [Macrolepiota fuliginosa MF-IS2]